MVRLFWETNLKENSYLYIFSVVVHTYKRGDKTYCSVAEEYHFYQLHENIFKYFLSR